MCIPLLCCISVRILEICLIYVLLQALRSFKLADIVNILERLLGITLVNPHHEYGSIKRVT